MRTTIVVACIALLAVAVSAGPVVQTQGPIRGYERPVAPSLLGPTGAIVTPTMDTVGDEKWQVGFHYWQPDDEYWLDSDYEEMDADVWAPKVNFGLGPYVEVGVAYFNVSDDGLTWPGGEGPPVPFNVDMDETIVNLKIKLAEEGPTNPGFAVGLIDLGDQIDFKAYAVLGKTFFRNSSVPITLNIGAGSGDDQKWSEDALVALKSLDGFFGSLTIHITPNLQVMAEYDSEEDNYAVRWWPWNGLSIEGGIIDDDFFAGLAYRGSF